MSFTSTSNEIFRHAIADYHITDNVDTPIKNPFPEGTINNILYHKCWIDTVQWHFEDIIRDPNIDPAAALVLKTYFREHYKDVKVLADATINTESPAWAIDRLSILALKIYHMKEQVERTDATPEHIAKCKGKLDILLEQQVDLSTAIDQLLADIASGKKYMKVYRQMKMYNDADTNPVLYGKK